MNNFQVDYLLYPFPSPTHIFPLSKQERKTQRFNENTFHLLRWIKIKKISLNSVDLADCGKILNITVFNSQAFTTNLFYKSNLLHLLLRRSCIQKMYYRIYNKLLNKYGLWKNGLMVGQRKKRFHFELNA